MGNFYKLVMFFFVLFLTLTVNEILHTSGKVGILESALSEYCENYNEILLTSPVSRVTGAVQAELQDQLHQDVLAMCRMWIKTRGGRPGPGPWWCCQTRRRYGCSTILSAPISFISFHVLACLNSCLGCLHKWTTNQKTTEIIWLKFRKIFYPKLIQKQSDLNQSNPLLEMNLSNPPPKPCPAMNSKAFNSHNSRVKL